MKMKRLLAAMTAGFMCLSLAACSGNENSVQQSGTSSDTSSSDATATTTAPKEENSVAEDSSAAEENTSLSGKITVYMPSTCRTSGQDCRRISGGEFYVPALYRSVHGKRKGDPCAWQQPYSCGKCGYDMRNSRHYHCNCDTESPVEVRKDR